jgi:hypothetical protein
MVDAAKEIMDRWATAAESGERIDVADEMMSLTQATSCGRSWAPIWVRLPATWVLRGQPSINMSARDDRDWEALQRQAWAAGVRRG